MATGFPISSVKDASITPQLTFNKNKIINTFLESTNTSGYVFDSENYESFVFSVSGDSNTIWIVESSIDAITWSPVLVRRYTPDMSLIPSTSSGFNVGFGGSFYVESTSRFYRIKKTSSIDSLLRLEMLPNRINLINDSDYSLANNKFEASFNGVNSSSNTILAAGTPYQVPVLYSANIQNIGTSGTEFEIRIGSTVLYSGYINAGDKWALPDKALITAPTFTGNSTLILNLTTTTNVLIYGNFYGFKNIY